MLSAGIVGLPNVGKSTLFNAVTRTHKAPAENYPFCTIDPNVGVVTVPDRRLEKIAAISNSKKITPTAIEFVDTMPEGTGVRSAPGFDVAVIYERTIDVAVECERLKKELVRFEKEISNADRQLSNEGFLAKAPANVVEGLRRRAAELSVLIPKNRAALNSLNCDNH